MTLNNSKKTDTALIFSIVKSIACLPQAQVELQCQFLTDYIPDMLQLLVLIGAVFLSQPKINAWRIYQQTLSQSNFTQIHL